jgi:hypothetical protein
MCIPINYDNKTFIILDGGLAIKCLICGLISYNLNDVYNRYCGYCRIFHD